VSDTGQPAPDRPRKGAAAFRTIGEVADELDLPAHVLRFWETKFPQLNPVKRGGGRRYYRPEDVRLLRRIRHWLYQDGYTIRGVQQLLESRPSRGAATGEEPGAAGLFMAVPDAAAGTDLGAGPASAAETDAADRPPAASPPDIDRMAARLDPATRAELDAIRRDLLQARALLDALLRQSKGS
jgi:DNA-binding transcriptional MerR regulator